MADKVLFIDDEPGVLESYERLLRREFNVHVALGGEKGLHAIQEYGPFAVVISDMRMPGMNGAEFLAKVRQQYPDSVRMLLTGYTDINIAIEAVNQGNILRFLSKPCDKDALVEAINIGLDQYRSVVAEREIIKKAQTLERASTASRAADICQWDNFQGPTGLPGPSQARDYLTPLLGVDHLSYVILIKLTALQTFEQRYGEEASGDYLNIEAQYLMQVLRSEDRLFHWGRDVLMAVVRRQLSPAAMRMEISRLTAGGREHVLEVNGRRVMITRATAFDLLPVSQFATLEEMFACFNPKLMEGI